DCSGPAALRRTFLATTGPRAVDHERASRIVLALAPAHLAPGGAPHPPHAEPGFERREHRHERPQSAGSLLERAAALRRLVALHLELLAEVAGGLGFGHPPPRSG